MPRFKKLLISYFSGTGNSRNVALALEREGIKAGLETSVVDIAVTDRKSIPSPEPDALLFFVSPVHGFNYPVVMLNYIFRFPRGRNTVVLMNTRAGMLLGNHVTPGISGVSFYLAALVLKLKGYRIQGFYPVDLPSNWMSVHPGLNTRTVDFLYGKALPRVCEFARRMFAGERDFWCVRSILIDAVVAPITVLYFLFGRFMIAKTFYASNDCNHCGLCSQQCPVHAIELHNGRPFWTCRCESCMRCIGSCPKRAIETAHGMVSLFAVLFGWLFASVIDKKLLPFSILQNEGGHCLIECGLFTLASIAGYRLFHYCLRYRWFERLTVYTSLTKLKFWNRYKAGKRV